MIPFSKQNVKRLSLVPVSLRGSGKCRYLRMVVARESRSCQGDVYALTMIFLLVLLPPARPTGWAGVVGPTQEHDGSASVARVLAGTVYQY